MQAESSHPVAGSDVFVVEACVKVSCEDMGYYTQEHEATRETQYGSQTETGDFGFCHAVSSSLVVVVGHLFPKGDYLLEWSGSGGLWRRLGSGLFILGIFGFVGFCGFCACHICVVDMLVAKIF